MDEQNSIIGKMDTKLFPMGFNLLYMNGLQGGLNVFDLAETEFDLNVPSLKNFFQLVNVMMNKRSFGHELFSLGGFKEINI